MQQFDIVLRTDLSLRTSQYADEILSLLDEHGVRAIDILGSVGSGKTSLVIEMVKRLKDRMRIAVIAGDVTTRIDADRIEAHGVPVLQIQTGGMCHLDTDLVGEALEAIDLDGLDLLIIENVGNLICPGSFPLGAHQRLVVISVTEGPYAPRKHPVIFNQCSVAVINKIDLADAMDVSVDQLVADAHAVNPRMEVIPTNLRAGEGVDEVIAALGL
ncbi:MAG: hydrogenase nickel incorporation protein HypB [Armatimonadetes bacterium]|nr:hydrogenase nickel incorporation protein HypB [Armatimonadota bacterium]